MSTTTTTRPATRTDPDWRWIRTRFPRDLDALARRTDAATFWRQMPSAEVLLRMLLLWALCGFGLRSVAAWGARSGWAELTADSLRYRFRQCEAFLVAVLTHVLRHWVRVESSEGLPLRLVDASMLAVAGPTGRVLRVHAVFDPRQGCLRGVEVTDDKAGEDLTRASHDVGALVIADRGLARAASLVALSLRQVFWIVRVHLSNLKVWDAQGTRVDLAAEALCQAAEAHAGPLERAVELRDGAQRVAARLVVLPLPPARAAAARAKLLQRARKKSRQTDARSLLLAGYVMLLTTLPPTVASAAAVLQWYRVRWQIELFFKRCKSLLGLRTVVTACDRLQRVRLLASMLGAALVDRLNAPAVAQAPPTPPSLWRWTQLHHLDLVRAVSGATPLSTRRARVRKVEPLLRERPRKRLAHHAAHLVEAITSPRPTRRRQTA